MHAAVKMSGLRGMILVEVLMASVLMSIVMASLLGLLIVAEKTRLHADARRAAAQYAHDRCMKFAKGQLYGDVFEAFASGCTTTQSVPIVALPGGATVIAGAATEAVTIPSDGGSAALTVSVSVETAWTSTSSTTVKAGAIRFK